MVQVSVQDVTRESKVGGVGGGQSGAWGGGTVGGQLSSPPLPPLPAP